MTFSRLDGEDFVMQFSEDQSILEPAARERVIVLLRQLDATQLDAVYGFIVDMLRSDAAIDARMRCASPEVDKWFDK